MNLETLVTSYEMSKKLQDAGFDAPTCFWWVGDSSAQKLCYCDTRPVNLIVDENDDIQELEFAVCIRAYTFQQIWNLLPEKIKTERGFTYKSLSRNALFYESLFVDEGVVEYGLGYGIEAGKTLQDAVAEAWLWCKENNYLGATK